MGNLWSKVIEWIDYTLEHFLTYLLAFVAGALGYLIFSLWLLPSPLLPELLEMAKEAYTKVGVTFLALGPLSIYLVILIILVLVNGERMKAPGRHFRFVIEVGPLLGILGTMIAMTEATAIDLSKDLMAIRQLTPKVGQALLSSIFGIMLALLAYIVVYILRLDEEGRDEDAR